MTAYHCNQVVICHWSEAIKRAVGYFNVKLKDVKIRRKALLKLLHVFWKYINILKV